FTGKYLVLFFYPLDFTFVCPTEIIAFSDRVEEFRAINCEVIACSVDSHFSHLAWTEKPRKKGGLGTMNIPLLSDITKQISKDYGVLLEDQGVALRGLFIVDDKGILRQITMNDLPVGRSVDEVLRLVQAFQFTDKHGEVCPAGWRPGNDTVSINPFVISSKRKSPFSLSHEFFLVRRRNMLLQDRRNLITKANLYIYILHVLGRYYLRKAGNLYLKVPKEVDETIASRRQFQSAKVFGKNQNLKTGLFIVDDKGILRQITMNDLPVGRSVDEVLRLVQAFQFTDKHGEVCPAGWRPGNDTIVPDAKKSADYFSKQS
ncbi:unnamed protein product, partial [Porites evermanni]